MPKNCAAISWRKVQRQVRSQRVGIFLCDLIHKTLKAIGSRLCNSPFLQSMTCRLACMLGRLFSTLASLSVSALQQSTFIKTFSVSAPTGTRSEERRVGKE